MLHTYVFGCFDRFYILQFLKQSFYRTQIEYCVNSDQEMVFFFFYE